MKYASFKDTGRRSVNIGDYLQFMAANYLLRSMNVPESDIVYLGFHDIAHYDGEEVIFPFCYSIIDFVSNGRLNISSKIKPVFFSVTLSTVDKFMNLDTFLEDRYNRGYLLKYAPIGCRDEITYRKMTQHRIPAYINGCMTAIFPRYTGERGKEVLFIDAPKALLPYIPDHFFEKCTFSTQQYYFDQSEIDDYKRIFRFVAAQYQFYQRTARLAVTSRLHVALPLTAFGIPVILAKDYVDGRFSFIEKYIPVYGKNRYQEINWQPETPDIEQIKRLLVTHAMGMLQNNLDKTELVKMERELTCIFQSRTVKNTYQPSHAVTHNNGQRFDEYAAKYWAADASVKYAFWGVSENNVGYWQEHIKSSYPLAELTAVFDSFREGQMLGLPYQRPEKILDYPNVCVIVCSVGAAQAAQRFFHKWNLEPKRYCITSDCFIGRENAVKRTQGSSSYDLYPNNSI